MNYIREVPWKLFILLSLAGTFLATAIWLPAWFIHNGLLLSGSFIGYPAFVHSEQMLSLFMVPLMSAALLGWHGDLLEKEEKDFWVMALLGGEIVLLVLSYLHHRLPFYSLLFFILLGHAWIFRGLLRTPSLPGGILYTGLVAGVVALFFFILSQETLRPWYFEAGRSMLFYGFFLALPASMALEALGKGGTKASPGSGTKRAGWKSYLAPALFLITFPGEWFFFSHMHEPAPRLFFSSVRLALFLFWMIRGMGRGSLPGRNVPRAIFWAVPMSAAGIMGYSLSLDMGSHWSHLYFIGGILPMSLYGMTSLLRGQTGESILRHEKENPFRWIWILLLLAAVIRTSAMVPGTPYFLHLGLSALLVLVALSLWFMDARSGLTP